MTTYYIFFQKLTRISTFLTLKISLLPPPPSKMPDVIYKTPSKPHNICQYPYIPCYPGDTGTGSSSRLCSINHVFDIPVIHANFLSVIPQNAIYFFAKLAYSHAFVRPPGGRTFFIKYVPYTTNAHCP